MRSAWKGKLLEDLYCMTLRMPGGATTDPHAVLESRKEEVRVLLCLVALDDTAHEALWKQPDVGVFLCHDARDIARFTRHFYNRIDMTILIARACISPAGVGLQVVVYSLDRPDLFTCICDYFERKSLTILDAKVHTTKHGYALDIFQMADPGSGLAEPGRYRDIITLVEHELTEQISRETVLPEPPRGRISRQSRNSLIKPRVDLRADGRGQYYLLSISATDRTGLLYAIARVLAHRRVSVHTARINTLGERVEDIFLVDSIRLTQDNKSQLELESELLDALAI